MPVDIPAFAYAAIVAAGGVMGYVKSSKYVGIYIYTIYEVYFLIIIIIIIIIVSSY